MKGENECYNHEKNIKFIKWVVFRCVSYYADLHGDLERHYAPKSLMSHKRSLYIKRYL